MAWQTPKTNWKAADVVSPTDMNRIEGNIEAIETGARTVDPAQVPSGNTGTLRQFLNWLPNRIKAITGKTNWYDTPDTTLAAAKTHIDATTVHGATNAATANRIILRDASGRAQVASPSAAADIATKGYVDSAAAPKTHIDATTVHGATNAATANRIILRDASGRAKVAAPSASDDIATKGYVDSCIIEETGSNTNGKYVKFANGLMICTRTVSFPFDNASNPNATVTNNYNFPANFKVAPYGNVSGSSASTERASILCDLFVGTTTTQWTVVCPGGYISSAPTLYLVAIGWWE